MDYMTHVSSTRYLVMFGWFMGLPMSIVQFFKVQKTHFSNFRRHTSYCLHGALPNPRVKGAHFRTFTLRASQSLKARF